MERQGQRGTEEQRKIVLGRSLKYWTSSKPQSFPIPVMTTVAIPLGVKESKMQKRQLSGKPLNAVHGLLCENQLLKHTIIGSGLDEKSQVAVSIGSQRSKCRTFSLPGWQGPEDGAQGLWHLVVPPTGGEGCLVSGGCYLTFT